MTCQASSFSPNSQLQRSIVSFVDQCNRGSTPVLERDFLERLCQILRSIHAFASIHPQPAREAFGELIKANNLEVRCLSFASSIPLLFPTMIVYFRARLKLGEREESIQGTCRLMDSLGSLSLTLARETLGNLLSFEVEEIQLQAARNLLKLLSIETLAYDVEEKQSEELIDLEKQVRSIIEVYTFSDSPSDFLIVLLSLYQSIIEKLFLLSYFEKGQNNIIYDHALANLSRIEKLLTDLSPQSTQNQSVRYQQISIRSIFRLISFRLTGKNLKTAESLEKLVGSPFLSNTLGELYQIVKNYPRAIFHFQKSLWLCEQGLKHAPIDKELNKCKILILSYLGNAYTSLCDYSEAIKCCEKRLEISRKILKNLSEESDACNDLANIYLLLGEYTRAIQCYKRSLELVTNPTIDFRKKGITLGNMGNVYREQREYSKAISYYEQFLGIVVEYNYPIEKIEAYNNIGNFYTDIQQYPKALEYYNKALEAAKLFEDQQGEANAYANMGITYMLAEDYSKATEYYDKSLKIMEQIGNLYGIGSMYGRKGIICKLNKKYEEAVDCHIKHLKIAQSINNRKEEGIACSNLANAYRMLKNIPEAVKFYQNSLAIAIEICDRQGEGETYNNLGVTALMCGKDSISFFKQAIACFSEIQGAIKQNQWKITIFERQSVSYRALETALISLGNYKEALQVVDTSRARVLVQSLEKKPLQNSAPSLAATNQNMTFIVYSLTPSSMDEKNPDIGVWVVPSEGEMVYQRLELSETLKVESPDLLNEFPYQTKGAAQETSSPEADFLDLATDLIQEETKRSWAERQKEKDQDQEAKRAAFLKQLRDWYDTLIAPIEQYLPQSQETTLTLLPDSSLATLPFALFQDQEGKYLIEKHPIAIASSIQTLDLLAKKKAHTALSRSSTIVSMPNNPMVSSIKSSGKETEAIQEVLSAQGEISVLAQKEATISNILEKAQNCRFLHIDCHGIRPGKSELKFDPHSVYEGGLYLTPEIEEEQSEFKKPGCLYADQISQMSLNAELVVLSACHSGRGKLLREGVVGLPHAFLAAGALSVVATYWELPASDLTIGMLKAFYSHILGTSEKAQAKGGPLDKAQALREAMLLGIEKERNKPELWGAFFLTGIS
ncbi:MAG: CHAT domain-containing protein [Simkania sp.]|nr:CHAT domain-containing protein [Simkania sp.]